MYKTTALIPFNMVLDVEVGLIRLIKYDYSQNEIFDQAILSNEDNIFFKDILSKRMNRNPLTAIATDKYIDNLTLLDDLYNQFMKEKYDEILELSPPTSLFDMLNLSVSFKADGIACTIWCKYTKEKDVYKSRLGSRCNSFIIEPSMSNIDLSPYGSIYINDYRDALFFSNLKGKNIFVSDYRYNFEDDTKKILLNDVSDEIKNANSIRTINIHKIPIISG